MCGFVFFGVNVGKCVWYGVELLGYYWVSLGWIYCYVMGFFGSLWFGCRYCDS